ncbi:Hint domain-containing protein [Amycolatopsis sp. CA-161197]|uniref:Hint domain-containing protein n=1 Tax=Amycolatopsis sp. CA-161197 TaxID=3239922 RepID=UPI003D8BA914
MIDLLLLGGGAIGDAYRAAGASSGRADATAAEDAVATCRNSFSGGTPVLMADGSTKQIEDVKVGDKVRNAEPDDSSTEIHTVTALHITDTDRDFVDVIIATPDGPKKITTTAHHLWWDVTTHNWTDATNLTPGDLLDTPGNGHATIQTLNRYISSIRTYNLTIDTIHTYYVLAGNVPVLVHNSGPFCGTPIGGRNGDNRGEEDFHGTEYSLDEMVGFVEGHTGGGNPTMGRPTAAEVETTLRQAGPVRIGEQNAAQFDYNGVRVIINYNIPWKSTSYYPGSLGKP